MNRIRLLAAFAALVLVVTAAAAAAGIYKGTDENGVVHFQDTSPAQGTEAQTVDPAPAFTDHAPEGAHQPSSTPRRKTPERLSRPAAAKVELYTTSWCPYCKKAVDFFRSRGIPFREYDIEKDPAAARRKQQLDSRSGVPLAVINGKKILGFSPAGYDRALKSD